VDSATYASSCDPVAADLVSDDVLGEGLLEGAPTQARRIQGVDPAVVVALRRPSDWCTRQEGPATVTWSLVHAAPGPTSTSPRTAHDVRPTRRAVREVVLSRLRRRPPELDRLPDDQGLTCRRCKQAALP